jgi:hypothetical protein
MGGFNGGMDMGGGFMTDEKSGGKSAEKKVNII